MDTNVFHVCNAHVYEGLLRETARQYHFRLRWTLVTCSGCVQAMRGRAAVPTVTSSQPLQHVVVYLEGSGKILLLGGGVYLVMVRDGETRMGWLYPLRIKSAADVATGTMELLADVTEAVKDFRTSNGAEFVN